jgi:hypothetical protein
MTRPGKRRPGIPGDGAERLIDAVVVLDREYPHAFEWTGHSRAARLRDSAIKATPSDLRIKVAGSGQLPSSKTSS